MIINNEKEVLELILFLLTTTGIIVFSIYFYILLKKFKVKK